MTRDFTGTVEINAGSYSVFGVLSIQGRRVNGTLRFSDNEDRLIPINLIVDGGLVTFHANAPTLFITPDDDLVNIEEIQSASTTLDLGVITIEVEEEDCLLNGIAALFSMSIGSVEEVEEAEGIDEVAEEEVVVTRKTLIPVRVNEVGNRLDHYGQILSTPRLLEERNSTYQSRINKAASEPNGSPYNGLIYSSCKEFGLEVEDAITVLKRDGLDNPERVVLSIEEDRAVIYSNWIPLEQQAPGVMPTIEQETVLTGMTVGKLVDWINLSEIFKAKLISRPSDPATHLLINSTNTLVQETLPPSEKIKTKEIPLRGTLFIGQESGLRRETTEGDRSLVGDYSVDYTNGFINSLFIPDSDLAISYMANVNKLVLRWAPIRIINMTSEGGQNLLFNQAERDFYQNERARYVNTIPTNETFFLLREIMNGGDFPQFWGE